MSLPHLYSEAEAAEYLGITELTLYRWRKAGKIACMMVGKSPRYSEQHILDYLKAREIPAAPVSEPKPKAVSRGPRRDDGESAMTLAYQILRDSKARREGN
ncbi:helix-turn-helix domain-containing protein [Luteibacter yeojuensis]